MKTLSLALIALLLASTPAFAQTVKMNLNDCSITSLTGSASQQILAANPNRKYLYIFNPNASDSIYANLAGGTAGTSGATSGTLVILHTTGVTFDGSSGQGMPTNAITVNGTAADAVTCYEGR